MGIDAKISISFDMKPNISINLPLVEKLWIEIETNKKKQLDIVYCLPVQTVQHIDPFSRALTNDFHELNSEGLNSMC